MNSFAIQISIESKVANEPWLSKPAIEPLVGQTVSLRIKEIDGASIKWFQIQPNINIQYNNAVWPWLPNAYKWKGYDKIKYARVPIHQFDDIWEVNILPEVGLTANLSKPLTRSDAQLSNFERRVIGPRKDKNQFSSSYMGSFWFQAEVKKDGRTFQTPGINSRDNRGISQKVFRVSIKQGNDLLGNLTSYFNVPSIFGSTPYQVKNHIGVDCADVLMAAYCKTNNVPIAKDYNVAMLTSKFKTIVKSRIRAGKLVSEIRWNKEIQAGDFIAVRYPKSKQYQHIGALYNDQNGNDLLDGEDLILHAGPHPLHFSTIKSGAFNGSIMILRPE